MEVRSPLSDRMSSVFQRMPASMGANVTCTHAQSISQPRVQHLHPYSSTYYRKLAGLARCDVASPRADLKHTSCQVSPRSQAGAHSRRQAAVVGDPNDFAHSMADGAVAKLQHQRSCCVAGAADSCWADAYASCQRPPASCPPCNHGTTCVGGSLCARGSRGRLPCAISFTSCLGTQQGLTACIQDAQSRACPAASECQHSCASGLSHQQSAHHRRLSDRGVCHGDGTRAVRWAKVGAVDAKAKPESAHTHNQMVLG